MGVSRWVPRHECLLMWVCVYMVGESTHPPTHLLTHPLSLFFFFSFFFLLRSRKCRRQESRESLLTACLLMRTSTSTRFGSRANQSRLALSRRLLMACKS